MFQKISEIINPQIIIIIGGAMAILGAYLAHVKNQYETSKTDGKVSETLTLTQKVHDLTKLIDQEQIELKNKQKEIEDLQNKNFQLSQSISSKALEISDYVSSKDSYACITLSDINHEKNLTGLMIRGIGKHPVKVYNIRIADLNSDQTPFSKQLDLTVFPEYGSMIPAQIPINISKPISWNIFFETSNGHLCEELRIKLVGKKILYSIKIFNMENTTKVLFQQIDKEFDKY